MEQVVRLIQAEVEKVVQEGITAEELDRAKESLKGQLVLGLGSRRPCMLFQRLLQSRALDRRAGREGIDLATRALVVGIELLDLFPARDCLVPVLVSLLYAGRVAKEIGIFGLGLHRFYIPLGKHKKAQLLGGLRCFSRRRDVPRIVRERVFTDIQRMGKVSL
ncbi:MAG: hypothetical protein ACXWOV_11410 [Isosphaeraceae bacterium]